MSDDLARRWLSDYCRSHNIDSGTLSAGEVFRLSMLVPCSIRCFRVGEPVEVEPGEHCPECGKPVPPITLYDYLEEPWPSEKSTSSATT